MNKETEKKDNRKYMVIVGIMIIVVILIMVIAAKSGGKVNGETDQVEIKQQTSNKEPIEDTQNELIIDHSIVGKWMFYVDINDMVNTKWILTFNDDGTYTTESSPSTKDGLVPKQDLYAYGTYYINTTPTTEELVYFHEVYQKTLDVEMTIETIDDIEYLSFFRSNHKAIVAGRLDGEEIYEKFKRITEE